MDTEHIAAAPDSADHHDSVRTSFAARPHDPAFAPPHAAAPRLRSRRCPGMRRGAATHRPSV